MEKRETEVTAMTEIISSPRRRNEVGHIDLAELHQRKVLKSQTRMKEKDRELSNSENMNLNTG